MATKTATRLSTLNPNAPMFIPSSYVAVDDFSPEWWHLVQTCPAFRDYWLRERMENVEDEAATPQFIDVDDLDLEDLLDMEAQNQDLEETVIFSPVQQGNGTDDLGQSEKDAINALAGLSMSELRSQKQRAWREPLKHQEKVASKGGGPRSPRRGGNQFRIQQPRP